MPASPLRRISAPLNWDRNQGSTDGDVKTQTIHGQKTFVLRKQPRGVNNTCRGVSFFSVDPTSPVEGCEALLHSLVPKSDQYPCAVTPINTALPPQLRIVNDHPIMVLLPESEQPVLLGQHWSLITVADDMLATTYDELYQQLLVDFTPCSMLGAAVSGNLDEDTMPTDRRSYVAVVALEHLAATTSNGNTALFATLFALHIRATNMDFTNILHFGNMTDMVTVALEQWVTRDLFMYNDAIAAQQLLAAELDTQPNWCKFIPPLERHPFLFLHGEYTEELYKDQIANVDPRLKDDTMLQCLVREHATGLLQKLMAKATEVSIVRDQSYFMYKNSLYCVQCVYDKERCERRVPCVQHRTMCPPGCERRVPCVQDSHQSTICEGD